MSSFTGYGARTPVFTGDSEDFEIWSIKFKGMMRLHSLIDILNSTADTVDASKNAQIFAYLAQCLDDKSLTLIIRDAEDDGRKAFNILKEHYLGSSKPRILSLYTELTSLKMKSAESVTDYVLRAETAAARLRQANEQFSDKLLIAMVLKGLPESFHAFSTIINSNEADLTFPKFKTQLRSFEETEAAREHYSGTGDDIRKLTGNTNPRSLGNAGSSNSPRSTTFNRTSGPKQHGGGSQQQHGGRQHGRPSHRGRGGRQKSMWCHHCKNSSHNSEYCKRRKSDKNYQIETVSDEETCFKISEIINESVYSASDNDSYLVDCGATTHIICDPSKIIREDTSFNPSNHTIELADNSRQTGVATSRGDAKIFLKDNNGKSHDVILKNALVIPSYKQNIISVHNMTNNGTSVTFSQNENFITTKKGIIFPINKSGRLYFVNSIENKSDPPKIPKIKKSLEEWHYTLGHCNTQDIINLQKITPEMIISDKKHFECNYCIEAKMTNKINRTPDEKASKPLELVHTDLCGPINPISLQGCRYAIVFVDDYSGLTKLFFLKNKSDASRATAKYIAEMSKYGNIKTIRSDGGGEFTSHEYRDLLIDNKIKHEMSAAHSPHQNGTAERAWRTLMETARTLIFQSKLPKYLWTYAMRHSAYVRNRCFSRTHKDTPYAKFTGKAPKIDKLKVFGTKCFSLVQNPSKLDKRALEGRYIGQDPQTPAHLVYHNKSVTKARNVTFSEKTPHNDSLQLDEPAGGATLSCSPSTQAERGPGTPPQPEGAVGGAPAAVSSQQGGVVGGGPAAFSSSLLGGVQPLGPANASDPGNNRSIQVANSSNSNVNNSNNCNISSKRSKRNTKPPAYLSDYDTNTSLDSDQEFFEANSIVDQVHYIDYIYAISNIPVNYNAAMESDFSNEWHNAMQNEYESLIEMDTFELVPRPDRKVIGGRWVYSKKLDQNQETIYKARYVAKGFSQTPSLDYDEIFSPTARLTSIRTLCQISVQENLNLYQLDVKTAYLNADIDHQIYLEQPRGFEVYDNDGSKLVLKLKKSIYGLKQAGRMWNRLLHDFLVSEGFVQSGSDHCVYTRSNNGNKAILIVWVDDIILACSCPNDAKIIKSALSNRFKMKDFGILSNFLGIDFKVSKGMIKLNQSQYIDKLLDRFKMADCNPKSIPCDLSTAKLDFDVQSEPLENPRLYREIVGSLIYLMTCTRPDICYVVSVLSQHMAKPTNAHLCLAKYVLKYLKGTTNHGLIYVPSNELDILGYSDASWANSLDRKSTSGYCYRMAHNSSLISWKTKKQPIVAMSTCEAEYVAMAFSIQEGVFLQQLTTDLQVFPKAQPVTLFVDNIGSIELAKNPIFHKRTKHMDIRFHYIRSKVSNGSVILDYVPSKDNIADIFTKPCTKLAITTFAVSKPM